MILLTKHQMNKILSHSEGAYPEECCGLLVGQRRCSDIHVCEVHESTNIADMPVDRFEIDPQLRFDLERRMRGENLDLVGVYHSHPDGPASPSQTDIERAWESNLVWLITAVKGGNAVNTTAHILIGSELRFEETSLEIIAGDSDIGISDGLDFGYD